MKRKNIRIALAALVVSLIAAVGCAHTDKTVSREPFDKNQLNYLMFSRNKDGYWLIRDNISLYKSCIVATELMRGDGTAEEVEQYRAAAKELVGNIVMFVADPRNGYIYLEKNCDEEAVAHARSLIFLVEALQSDIEYTPEEEKLTRDTIVNAIRFIEKHQHPDGCWYENYINSTKALREYGVTMLHIHALKAARQAGFAADAKIIAKGEAFIKKGLTQWE